MNQKNKQLKKTGKRREEKSAKISPKLERILEYGQEFEQLIKRELETIKNDARTPSKQVSASKKSIIICATVVEKSGAEIMDNVFETTFVDDSNIVLMDPSFDFRNSARLGVLKYKVDNIFDHHRLDELKSTIIRPFVDKACTGVVSTIILGGKKSRASSLGETIHLLIQELFTACHGSWELSMSCLEISGSKAFDLLDMNKVVSTTAESTETHSSLDKKFERKHGMGKAGSVLGKAGSVYGISGGKGFTEVKCDSLAETSKKLQKVLCLRKTGSKSHFLLKLRLKHKVEEIMDGWINIIDLANIDQDTDSLIRKSYQVLRDCIKARLRAQFSPHRYITLPYKASKLTQLLKEVFILGPGRQVSFLFLAAFGPTVLDTQSNKELGNYFASLKWNQTDAEINPQSWSCLPPSDWSLDETVQWFKLQTDIQHNRIPRVLCRDLLGSTQYQFLTLMRKSTTFREAAPILDILEKLWSEVESLKMEEKEKIGKDRKTSFGEKPRPRWRLENNVEEDDKIIKALGTSKNKFQERLNLGFEKNIPRYESRTESMMQLDWAEKVKASDRAEAKLYPVLSIDTRKLSSENTRRFSICRYSPEK